MLEDSEDPDWVKQVCLSVLAGVGPYFVDASSTASTGHPTHVSIVSKTRAKEVRRVRPMRVSVPMMPPIPHPTPITGSINKFPKAVPMPKGVSTAAVTPKSVSVAGPEISQQIAPASGIVHESARIYSYAGVSFSWQPGQAVTFQSLPGPWACIAMHESSDMVQRSNPGSSAKGAFQIKSLMWAKYKLPDYPDTPNQATLAQQYHAALRIFQSDGFAEWETAPLCGV